MSDDISRASWEVLSRYVKPGSKVAELYNRGETELLEGLAKLVGQEGMVYGVNKDNPERTGLTTFRRVNLISADIPPLPEEIREGMDAILVRNFLLMYNLVPADEEHMTTTPNVSIYQSIRQAINLGGIFAVVLNVIEQDRESGSYTPYQDALNEHLRNFRKVHHEKELMVYEKFV